MADNCIESTEQDPTPVSGRVPVLVVDDDAVIRTALTRFLRKEGYEPVVCNDSREACEALKKTAFDLAFVDINLPDASGLDLACRIKARHAQGEVVMITGSDALENAVQAIKIGAYDYLRKPFSMGEISLCLRRFEERRQLRERIRVAEQRYHDLVQHLPLLIYVLSDDLRLDFVNKACSDILGYAPEEAINTHNWLLERIHPEDRDRVLNLFQSAFSSGVSPLSVECRLLHKKGHAIHAIIKSIPSFGCLDGSRVGRLEGIILDITERVLFEKALVQEEKLKTLGAIAAEVAHEIRNPLMSIGGFAMRLKKKHPELQEADIIIEEARKLEAVVGRIKDYLQPVDIRTERVAVNEVIGESVALLSPELNRRRVDCRMELDVDNPVAAVDKSLLNQVCINLIRNATKPHVDGGILVIRSFTSGKRVHLEFASPQVEGVKVVDPEMLFLPFDEAGYHIGLPLSYRLVKNMGGVLSFSQESQQLVFSVSLPRADGSDADSPV